MICSWDDYSYNGQNYFLYNQSGNPDSPKFAFIPWDMDHSLGNDSKGQPEWGDLSPLEIKPVGPTARPPLDRIVSHPELRPLLVQRIQQFCAYFKSPDWEKDLREQQLRIQRWAERDFEEIAQSPDDDAYHLSRPWQANDFMKSLDEAPKSKPIGYKRIKGMLPMIQRRIEVIEKYLNKENLAYVKIRSSRN